MNIIMMQRLLELKDVLQEVTVSRQYKACPEEAIQED